MTNLEKVVVKEIEKELKKYDVEDITFSVVDNGFVTSVSFTHKLSEKPITSFRINKGLNSFTIEELVLKAVEEIQKKQK